MSETILPNLRLPPRARPVESDNTIEAGIAALKSLRSELSCVRDEIQRLNSVPDGAGLFNYYGGLGVDLGFNGATPLLDPSALPGTLALANSYFPITLNWNLLVNTYMSQGLVRRLVDVVVDDGFGDGVEFTSGQLDDEELDELRRAVCEERASDEIVRTRAAKINLSGQADLSNSDLEAWRLVGKWGRLLGGAGLIVNTTQKMDADLRIDSIGRDTPLTFIAADRWELLLDQSTVNDPANVVPYNYYGLRLNRSRVSRYNGLAAPSRIRQKLQGWGMSVLEDSLRAINAFLKFEKLVFELMDEAKVDVYRLKNFNTNLLSARGTQQLMQRAAIVNQAKNFQNSITMDKEDEFEQKTLAGIFPGLAALRVEGRIDLCAYMQIPYNKLFGQSSGGFSSGKDALDNYNSTVRNFRTTAKPMVKTAAKLRCQQLFGMVPDDLDVKFPALSILDGVEQEQVKTQQQTRIVGLFSSGLLSGAEASEELRKLDLITVDETEVEQGLREAVPAPSLNPGDVDLQTKADGERAKNAAKVQSKREE